MSNFSEMRMGQISRRGAIAAALALGHCQLHCEAASPQEKSTSGAQTIEKALGDASVRHGKVEFKSGDGQIDGYLSRPKADGRFPVVLVITGSSISDEYIQNMTAMFAQQGLVAIAPNIFFLQKESMSADEKRKVFAEQITDERIFQDIQAAIDYLKTQDYANTDKIGITGFCFGGRCALMFAAHSSEIDAVAPFYGNLRTPAFANRKKDPLDVLDKIKVPVQGHYAASDSEIPSDQLQTMKDSLTKQGTEVELFTYDAPHGFFAYTRRTYRAEAAKKSWERTIEFFRAKLVR